MSIKLFDSFRIPLRNEAAVICSSFCLFELSATLLLLFRADMGSLLVLWFLLEFMLLLLLLLLLLTEIRLLTEIGLATLSKLSTISGGLILSCGGSVVLELLFGE